MAKLPPHIRKDYQNEFLQKCLKHEKFFWELKWKLPKTVFSSVFAELRYEYFQKMQIIEQIGDRSKRVYFVLEGEMILLKPILKESAKDFVRHRLLETEEIAERSKKCIRKLKDEEIFHRNFPDYELGDLISKAGIYGEKCLEKDEIRHDLVLAKENTSCLLFNGETIRNLISKMFIF